MHIIELRILNSSPNTKCSNTLLLEPALMSCGVRLVPNVCIYIVYPEKKNKQNKTDTLLEIMVVTLHLESCKVTSRQDFSSEWVEI